MKSHRFTIRSVTKIAISVLLVASVGLGIANLTKPDPVYTDNSWENSVRSQKLGSVATAFAAEFYTVIPGDSTWLERIKPYTSSAFPTAGKISVENVNVTQTIKRIWVNKIDSLVGDIYNVSVSIVATVKDIDGKSTPRYMIAIVPVEISSQTGQAYVVANPALLPRDAELPKSNGIKLDGSSITTAEVTNVEITFVNFMQKLASNSTPSDLRNFTSGNFVPKSLGAQVKFIKFESFDVYPGMVDEDGNVIDYRALAKATMQDTITGQVFSPTYAYRFESKEGKYYITWMSNE